jgi:hypothetical protein
LAALGPDSTVTEASMSVDERDFRMLLVAFEDATTWCESLADIAEQFIRATVAQTRVSDAELERAISQVAETRRFLQADQHEVQRIKERVGLM